MYKKFNPKVGDNKLLNDIRLADCDRILKHYYLRPIISDDLSQFGRPVINGDVPNW